MKNLHLIPTDKPSRLSILNSGKLNFGAEAMSSSNSKLQHIYITSDEEIKEGDWFLEKAGRQYPIHWNGKDKLNYHCKKIILTTDQDLINDGVQAIDDEFLEWFVENPSCEFVEIVKCRGYLHLSYMIIIPQEEPKQETLDFISKELDIERKRVHKQETLEEAAKRTYQKGLKDDLSLSFHDGVKFGAEWQAERMYSEEEVLSILNDFIGENPIDVDRWFEQFKKNGGDK